MILSGRTKARTGWIAGVLLLLVATAVLPLAAVVRADPKDAAAPLAEPIKTELKLKDTRFRADAPIIVDVWVENQTEQDIERYKFSPISSSVGLPDFVIVRVPDGKEFSIPPGFYGDDWDQWYQPVSGKRAFSVGGFSLPSGKRIHLLHGDLRLTVVRAREHCQRALDEDSTLKRPDNASTKKHYQEIVRSADDFLSGGTFDIRVRAYSRSQTIRITVDKKDSQPKDSPDEKYQDELRVKQVAEWKAHLEDIKKAGAAYLAKNRTQKGVVTTESGLQYKILRAGTGKSPKGTDTVKIHYFGTLTDGTPFDTSFRNRRPRTTPVTGPYVIKGWTEALQLMKVGAKWKLFISSDLAYGEHPVYSSIGPNAVLLFEIELLEIVE